MKRDNQLRRSSKDVSLDKLHPSSDMGKRAKGGDKFANPGVPRAMKGSGDKPMQATTTKKRK